MAILRNYRALAAAFALVLALPNLAVAETPAEQAARVIRMVDKRYNSLRSLKADFIETYRGAGLARQESGTLLLKKPGKMRWDYRQPREKVFVTDGKTAYFYVPGERQARRSSMKQLDDLRSPLRFLLGRTQLRKELEGLTVSREATPGSPENIVISGVPKHLAERVSQLLLEVNPQGQIVRIYIEEQDGTSTEFRFTSLLENAAIPDEQFRFRPPANVEVIEQSGVAP